MNTPTASTLVSENGRPSQSAAPIIESVRHNPSSQNELNADTDVPSPERNRKYGFKRVVLIVITMLAGLGFAKVAHDWWTVGRFIESTDDAYIGGDVTVIAPKVAGFISTVAIGDNQHVHAGDLLIKLECKGRGGGCCSGGCADQPRRNAATSRGAGSPSSGYNYCRRRRNCPCARRSSSLCETVEGSCRVRARISKSGRGI